MIGAHGNDLGEVRKRNKAQLPRISTKIFTRHMVVIARSEATKQSIPVSDGLPRPAEAGLAMTK